MDCVVLFRNPSNGAVGFICKEDGSDSLLVFPNEDAAVAMALEHYMLRVWPYQIVVLDEL